jgi:hypothetical protein
LPPTEELIAVPIPPNGFIAIKEPSPYKIFRIAPSDPATAKFINPLTVRAIEFIDKYHSDTDVQWLVTLLHNHFKQNTNLVHVLIAVDKDEKIVAHSISYVDTYGSLGYVAYGLQAEKDKPVTDADIAPAKLMFEDWVRSLGIKTILATTIKSATARLACQRDGFYEYRTITRKDLT